MTTEELKNSAKALRAGIAECDRELAIFLAKNEVDSPAHRALTDIAQDLIPDVERIAASDFLRLSEHRAASLFRMKKDFTERLAEVSKTLAGLRPVPPESEGPARAEKEIAPLGEKVEKEKVITSGYDAFKMSPEAREALKQRIDALKLKAQIETPVATVARKGRNK